MDRIDGCANCRGHCLNRLASAACRSAPSAPGYRRDTSCKLWQPKVETHHHHQLGGTSRKEPDRSAVSCQFASFKPKGWKPVGIPKHMLPCRLCGTAKRLPVGRRAKVVFGDLGRHETVAANKELEYFYGYDLTHHCTYTICPRLDRTDAFWF